MMSNLKTVSATRAVFGAALLAIVSLLGPSMPEALAGREPCRVRNVDGAQSHTSLQPAIAAATPGDRLEVRGTCRASATVDRDLVVKGRWTRAWGRARLEGRRDGRFVMTIEPGVAFVLRSMTVFGNRADRDGTGGGLLNHGITTLNDTRVRGPGYGTAVVNTGSLTINAQSRVGDGVENEGDLTLNQQSRIDGGGRGHSGPYLAMGVYNAGLVTLNGRSGIVDNRWYGISNRGTLVLNDESRITGNGRSGIHNRGSVVMNDSSRISHNDGAGVYTQHGGSLTMSGRSWISRNKAARGAGVFLRSGALTMADDSRIRHNKAGTKGGGLYVGAGTLVGVRCGPSSDANVRNNKPRDCVFE